MTSATTATAAVLRAAAATMDRLRAQGWEVLSEPESSDLPAALSAFRPDLVAHRGDEHVVVEIKSGRLLPSLTTVELAERIAELPGWRLDVVYVRETPETADSELLAQRAIRAGDLADADPEAALLLAWSAAEGVLHRLAESHGLDADDAGTLLAELASIGALTDEEHQRLRHGQLIRNSLAHGRLSPPVDAHLVQDLTNLTRLVSQRTQAA